MNWPATVYKPLQCQCHGVYGQILCDTHSGKAFPVWYKLSASQYREKRIQNEEYQDSSEFVLLNLVIFLCVSA